RATRRPSRSPVFEYTVKCGERISVQASRCSAGAPAVDAQADRARIRARTEVRDWWLILPAWSPPAPSPVNRSLARRPWYALRTVPAPSAPPKRLSAELALALCTLLWGSTFVVVKNSLDRSSVFVFLALRFSLAGLVMAVLRPGLLGRLGREEVFAGIRL